MRYTEKVWGDNHSTSLAQIVINIGVTLILAPYRLINEIGVKFFWIRRELISSVFFIAMGIQAFLLIVQLIVQRTQLGYVDLLTGKLPPVVSFLSLFILAGLYTVVEFKVLVSLYESMTIKRVVNKSVEEKEYTNNTQAEPKSLFVDESTRRVEPKITNLEEENSNLTDLSTINLDELLNNIQMETKEVITPESDKESTNLVESCALSCEEELAYINPQVLDNTELQDFKNLFDKQVQTLEEGGFTFYAQLPEEQISTMRNELLQAKEEDSYLEPENVTEIINNLSMDSFKPILDNSYDYF